MKQQQVQSADVSKKLAWLVLAAAVFAAAGWLHASLADQAKVAEVASQPSRSPGAVPAEFVGSYNGTYEVFDEGPNVWKGVVSLKVDSSGQIAGYAWLPASDGTAGLLHFVSGSLRIDGKVSLKCSRMASGTRDGVATSRSSPPVGSEFYFQHEGKISRADGDVALVARGHDNQGFAEIIAAGLARS